MEIFISWNQCIWWNGFYLKLQTLYFWQIRASTGLVVKFAIIKKRTVVKTGFHLNARIYCLIKGKAPKSADSTWLKEKVRLGIFLYHRTEVIVATVGRGGELLKILKEVQPKGKNGSWAFRLLGETKNEPHLGRGKASSNLSLFYSIGS